jgi:hypothetical protein
LSRPQKKNEPANLNADRIGHRAAAMRLTASGSSRSFSQAKLNRANGLDWPSNAYRRPVYQDTLTEPMRLGPADGQICGAPQETKPLAGVATNVRDTNANVESNHSATKNSREFVT